MTKSSSSPAAADELGAVAALLADQQWIFAKTMPGNPHWYARRKSWQGDDQSFIDTVHFIRKYGGVERYPDPVKGRPYTLLYVNGSKYWTMGAPCKPGPYDPRIDTILINRKVCTMPDAYHSALKALPPPEALLPTCQRWAHQHCLAFVHDIADRLAILPPDFMTCDLIYAEPPWEHGYNEFNRRAGKSDALPYASFLARLGQLCRNAVQPAVVIVGKRALNHLQPHVVRALRHNDSPAWAAGWRLRLPQVDNSLELLQSLAGSYECVGDFLAGYGRTGRIFAQAG